MRIYFSEKPKDLPKKWGDLNLAWYQNGNVCISRKKIEHKTQLQNINIIKINQICKRLWNTLDPQFKRDMGRYAVQYKKEYPALRKRGVSAYSVFLIVIYGLIRRFYLRTEELEKCISMFEQLLQNISVFKLIRIKILKPVTRGYRLNHKNWGFGLCGKQWVNRQQKCELTQTEFFISSAPAKENQLSGFI